MRVHTYVDGESHFVRSLDLWRRLHGDHAELRDIDTPDMGMGSACYPAPIRPKIRLEARAKFFWDITYPFLAPHPFHGRSIDGAAYFTSFAGDDVGFHEVCVSIRQHGFDPRVIRERSHLSSQRLNTLSTQGVVEKAKGVDIGLSVRVLEDAYHNIFDMCYLFTSDVDFLPLIRSLQRIGKKVLVFGYTEGLANRSELEYVPDAFVELGGHMRSGYQRR